VADNPDAVQVPIDADQASLARLTQALTDAMSQGVQAGISQSVKQFQSMLKPIANIAGESGGDAGDLWYKQFADRISNLSDAMNKMLDGMAQAFGSETRDMLSGFSHLLQASQGHAERMLRDVETGATKRLRPDELSARRQAMQRVGTGVTNVQQTLATQTAAVARVYAAEVNAEASAQRIANREREQLAAEARGIVTRQHQLDMVQLREDSALKIEAQKRVSVNEAHALRYALQEQKQVGTLASVQAREASQIAVMERRKGVTLEIQAVRDAGRERAFAERSLLDDQKHQQHLAQQAAKSGYKQEAIVLKSEQDRITTGVRHAAKTQLEAMRDARTDRSHEVKLELSDRQTAARAQLQAEKQAGNLVAIEARAAADQATAAARFAGERRVAITKTVLKTIVMLERGIGKAIQGVARTLTSALGRIATGTKNLLVKTGSSIGGLLRRNNSDMDAGLGSALHRRTGMMRSSFSQEEGIVGRSVAKQKAKLDELNQRSSRGVLGALTGRGMGGGIAAIAGGFSIAQFMREGYQEAVNLNEQLNKNKVLFGEASKTIIDFANTSVKTFGATKAEALEAAGTFGNLFRAANFDEQQAANMSAYLVNLAGDLSSFNNVPINDVFDALRSGLVGEMEPLRRFGIMLNETTLKAAAVDLGKVMDAKKPLDANAKAAAAFVEIFKQTSLAQGDFARTSKEGANAQRVMAKSFKELAASLMSKVLPYTTIVINLMTKAFMGLNEIISNDTNPIIKTLRTVLVGAAAGVGALLALKGVVEIFKVLGPTIKLALSPLGMVVVVAAAVGGGIALLMKKSEGFRDTMSSLGKTLSSVWSGIKDVVGSVFRSISDAISKYVVPVIKTAVNWLIDHLVPAFNAVVSFIKNSVVPGLYIFVAFILTKVYPVIKQIGSFIADAFMTAVNAVRSFWNELIPLIQPAIDGVKSLVSAIGSLFGGDASKMAGGASDLFSGIIQSITNIAGRIGELLAPVAQKVLKWFRSVFSAQNIKNMIMGFLDFVETVGRVLGGIVSHPNFIKAVGILVAAAVAIGGKFILGFVKGVIDNLPGLLGMVWDAFMAGLGAIWDNKAIFLTIAAGLIMIMPLIRRMFGRAGSEAGGGFFGGLKGAATGSVDFVRGVFRAAGSEVEREQKTMRKRLADINRERRVMGAGNIGFGNRPLTDKMLKTAESDLKALQDGYSKAQLAGMRFRYALDQQFQSFRRLGSAMGKIATGVGTMARSFGQALKTLTPAGRAAGTSFTQALKTGLDLGFTQMRVGFRAVWTEMKKIAKDQGTSVGKVAAQTVAAGIASSVGGFMASKAAGESGGFRAGLLTSAMSGLTAGLATGNPIIGVATAGFGLLGAAIGDAKKKAEDFKNLVKGFSQMFKGELVDAIEKGVVAFNNFKEGLDFKGVVGAIGVDTAITNQIYENIGEGPRKLIDEYNMSIRTDLLPMLKEANGDVDKFARLFSQKMYDVTTSSKQFRDGFGKDTIAVAKYIKQMIDSGEGWDNLVTRSNTLAMSIAAMKASVGADPANIALLENERRIVDLAWAHKDLVKPLFDTNSEITKQAKAIFDAADEAMRYARITADVGKASQHTESWIGKMNKALREGTKVTDVEENLTEVAKKIEILGVNADQAKGLIDQLFDFGGGNFQESVDNALVAVEGIGPRISGQLELGTKVGAANARENLRTLGRSLSDVIKTGIDTETILTPADAMMLTKDIFDAATAGLDPGSEAYKKIADEYNRALAGVQPVIDAAKASEQAAKFQEKVKAYLEAHPQEGLTIADAEFAVKSQELALDVEVKLKMKSVALSDSTGKSIERNPEAFAAGVFGKWSDGVELPAKVKVEKPKTDQVKTDFIDVGKAADEGVKKGVRDNKAIVISEMRALAIAAKLEAERALGVRSPSKVFAEIGKNVVRGLAVGISSSDEATDAIGRVTSDSIEMSEKTLGIRSPSRVFQNIGKMIGEGLRKGIEDSSQSVVDAAVQVVNNIIANVNGAISAGTATVSTLWAGLTGTDAAAPGGRGPNAAQTALGTVTTSFNSMLGSLAGSAQSLWDATAAGMGATAQQLDIQGESSVSLNAADVLGAQNLATISSYLNDIADYGETLLATGHPLSEVTATISNYVDQFTQTLVSMGFNADQINTLVDQLGLSSDALEAFGQQVAEIGDIAANTTVPTVLPPVTMPASTSPKQAFTSMQTATTNVVNNATNQTTNETSTVKNVNIELHTPTGDPQATALAVANRLAFIM